jgi:hypothetical protein
LVNSFAKECSHRECSLIQSYSFPKSAAGGTLIQRVNTGGMPVLLAFSKTAAAWCFNAHAIAWLQLPVSFGRQRLATAVSANDESPAHVAI